MSSNAQDLVALTTQVQIKEFLRYDERVLLNLDLFLIKGREKRVCKEGNKKRTKMDSSFFHHLDESLMHDFKRER